MILSRSAPVAPTLPDLSPLPRYAPTMKHLDIKLASQDDLAAELTRLGKDREGPGSDGDGREDRVRIYARACVRIEAGADAVRIGRHVWVVEDSLLGRELSALADTGALEPAE